MPSRSSSLLDPAAGVAGEERDHVHLGARGWRRPGRRSGLCRPPPARTAAGRWIVPGREPLDLEQVVDRRVGRHADDHRAAIASASVGWPAVPPRARVESEPQAAASAAHRSAGRPFSLPASQPAFGAVAGADRVDRPRPRSAGAATSCVRPPRPARPRRRTSPATARGRLRRAAGPPSRRPRARSGPAPRPRLAAGGRSAGSSSARPPSQRSSGSAPGSSEVVAPAARARRRRSAEHRRGSLQGDQPPVCTWRARRSRWSETISR